MKWKCKLFGEIADFRNGLNFLRSHTGETVKMVGVGDFQKNFRISFDSLDTVQVADKLADWDLLEDNDLLFVRSNGNKALIGRCLLIEGVKERTSFSGFTIRARLRDQTIDPTFTGYFFQSGAAKRAINYAGGGTNISNLSQSILAEIEIPSPPLPEQRKIADILTTWDEALTQLDALIEAQERRKKALMQQLLTGRRRLKPHGVSIKHLKASEIFTNRSERNTGALPVLSVTQDQGIVLRSSLERRIAHDEDNINTYKVVRAGDYVISLRSFQGGLEYSEVTGAVSPAYHVIRPIKEIDQSFYRHYFKSTDFISRLAIATIGIRDGKQISFTDFGFIKLPYPAIEDQKRIGAILDTADQQLTLFRAQRSALDQQKRGLMQRLLTGQIRVRP